MGAMQPMVPGAISGTKGETVERGRRDGEDTVVIVQGVGDFIGGLLGAPFRKDKSLEAEVAAGAIHAWFTTNSRKRWGEGAITVSDRTATWRGVGAPFRSAQITELVSHREPTRKEAKRVSTEMQVAAVKADVGEGLLAVDPAGLDQLRKIFPGNRGV